MKVCFFGCFFPHTSGGSEYQTYLLAQSLDRRIDEPFFLSLAADREGEEEIEGMRVHFFQPPRRRRWLDKGYLASRDTIEAVLRQERPDVVYQRMGNSATWLLQRLSKTLGFRFIWACATDAALLPMKYASLGALRRMPERFLARQGIRGADRVLVQSESQKRWLRKWFRRDAIVLRNGLPIPESVIRKPNDRVEIVWIGGMKAIKQPGRFVELAEHCRDLCGIRFTMVGRPASGDWQCALEKRIQASSNLRYLGEVTPHEVDSLLDESHILVNTSQYEGFPNTFVQAWLRGVSVVSLLVDPDGVLRRESIGYCSGDANGLVRDVRRLAADEALRCELGHRASAYARVHHSIDDVAGRFRDIVKDLAR